MTDRPIIFSAPMVLALLNGRKTMTRRLAWRSDGRPTIWQKVRVAGRLWVRETWQIPALCDIQYRATDNNRIGHWNPEAGPWRSPIHTPRWASRITLTVTEVRVERLQEITEADAIAEGGPLYVPGHGAITEAELADDPGYSNYINRRMGFEDLWHQLHGPGAWATNPQVVAINFRPELRNIDAPES